MNENLKIFIEDNIQNSSGSSLSEMYEKLRIAINSKNEQSIYQLSKIITRFYFKELKDLEFKRNNLEKFSLV